MTNTDDLSLNDQLQPAPSLGSEIVPRPRIWTVWLALIVAMAAGVITQVIIVVSVFGYFISQGKTVDEIHRLLMSYLTTPPFFILMIFTGSGMFGVVALGAARFSLEPVRKRLGLVPVTTSRAIYPLAVVGSLFPTAVGLRLAEGLLRLAPQLADESAAKLFEQMTPFWAAPFVICIGLIPGFCEEMMFRGYLQRRFVARWRPSTAIVLTSVLFGMVHLIPTTVLFATVIGLYFGVIAWKTGSTWPTIACHIFINSGINFWRMVIIFAEPSELVQSCVTWSVLAISAVCFAASLWLVFSRRPPASHELLIEQPQPGN